MRLDESDSVAIVVSDDVVIDEMVVCVIQLDSMVSRLNNVIGDDRILPVYPDDAASFYWIGVCDCEMADIDVVCIDGDYGCPIPVDDGVAPIFAEEVNPMSNDEILVIGTVVHEDPETIGRIIYGVLNV